MGIKVNFNGKPSGSSNKKKKNKKIKVIIITIIAIFVLYLLVQSIIRVYRSAIKEVPKTDKLYYKISDFKSLEEILNRYGCKFVRKDESKELLKIYLVFDRDLYTDNTSNETHFMNMSRVIAEYEDFKNFELIDESRDIDILITCEDDNIVEFKINGDVNYYLNHNSEINSKAEATNITNFSIQSNELLSLINNGWKDNNINLGTKESTCDDYNIYFDEGIKYKKISRQVFNVVFTDKYKTEVAGGLYTSSTPEDVKKSLGEPSFIEEDRVYGYLGKDNYLFFDFSNKQISVYPIQEITEEDEKELKTIIEKMSKSLDVKNFVNDLTNLWVDYDEYEFNENYVDLKYTLKGVELKVSNDSLKNGIFIYQNYPANKDIHELENTYITDKDMVFEAETARSTNEQLNRIEQGDYTEEERKEMGVNFAIRFQEYAEVDEIGGTGPMFFSRTGEYPDSELSRTLTISSYKWYDEDKIVYSVNEDGIYVYNCKTRVNKKITSLNDKSIIINSATDGKIVYNEEQTLNVNIQ